MRIWWTYAYLVSILVATGGACGGDESQPSLEEYFGRVKVVIKRAEQRTADDAAADPSGENLRNWVRGRADLLREVRDEISHIEPPDEVADDHNRLVDALSNLVAHVDEILDRAAVARSEAERIALAEGWLKNPAGNELEDRVRIACDELQRAADTRKIGVDLCYDPAPTE